jgi:hypothetical protein
MLLATTVKVQASPLANAVLVEMLKLVPLEGYVNATLPDEAHDSVNAPAAAVTLSLKVAARLPADGKSVAPLVGVVPVTDGGVFGGVVVKV